MRLSALLTAVLVCALLCTFCAADEAPLVSPGDVTDAISSAVGADNLENLLPGSASGIDVSGIKSVASDPSGYKSVISFLLDSLSNAVKKEAEGLSSVLFPILVTSAVLILRESFGFDGEIWKFVSGACVCAACAGMLKGAASAVESYVTDIHTLISGMVPVMASVYAMSGQVTTSALQSTVIVSALEFLQSLCADYLIPGARILFALTVADAVSSSNLRRVTAFMKNAVIAGEIAVMTVLTTVLYFQTVISSSGDFVLLKGARFAAGKFIPVIGSLVSEAAKTVASCLGVVRSFTGFFGIAAVVGIGAAPFFSVISKKIVFSICRAAAGILGNERAERITDGFVSAIDILASFLASSSVFFIIAMALFMRSFGE